MKFFEFTQVRTSFSFLLPPKRKKLFSSVASNPRQYWSWIELYGRIVENPTLELYFCFHELSVICEDIFLLNFSYLFRKLF
jgi:hypothetical protein